MWLEQLVAANPELMAAPRSPPNRQNRVLCKTNQAFNDLFQTQTDHLTLHNSLRFHFTQGNKNNSLNHFKYSCKSLTTLTFSKALNQSLVDSQNCYWEEAGDTLLNFMFPK